MIRMVNRLTGGEMWVHESRVPEYVAAGHSLAAPPAPARPIRPENVPDLGTAPKRKNKK